MAIDLKTGSSKIRQNLTAVAYRAKPLGISRCDDRDTPTVASIIVRMTTVGKLEAVIAKSARSGEPVFKSMDVLLFRLSL
jgi:hypothetical protein